MYSNQMKYSPICFCVVIIILTLKSTNGGQLIYNPLLLYSTNKDIRIANTTKNSNNKFVHKTLVNNFTFEGPAVDYNYEKQKLCWTNHDSENILCDDFDGMATKNKVKEITSGVESPGGLACDWFTNKLYWTDSETKRIEVVSMETLHRKVLFWTDIYQPRAIALAPMKGLMFWTDWGEVQKIERAGMDGNPKTRKVIVNDDIVWPNGLTIDFENELIYWIDGNLKFLEVMTFDGTNRTKLLKEFEYPFALTMFQTTLFWTDWKTWSIHLFNRSTNVSREIIHHLDTIPMYIQVYDKRRQPKQNHPCEKNNGGCSHLCLLSPVPPGYSCACPVGIKLISNLTCASQPQELLLLAVRTDIFLIHLDSPDYTHKTLPLNDLRYAIGVDFDPVDGYIYWTDDEVKKIQRARLNGSNQEDIVTNDIQHPDGIAVDWVSRNIYWTDAGTDRVEVCTIKEKYRKVIIYDDLMEPRAIAVAPELGWMFWSDWYEKNTKIERSNLDGSERRALIVDNLGWPNGITLDLEKKRLYWCDAKKDVIEYSDMNGKNRMVLINDNIPHVFGFSLMDDFLYWTDWQRRIIVRAHKETGRSREIILSEVANVMGLKAIKLGAVSRSNNCSVNNGGCSQFCFSRHNQPKICACELGYELASDNRTCVKPENFLLFSKQNQIGMIGIENQNNEISIPVTGFINCSSIDYDINSMYIYWSDSGSRTIMRALVNGSNPQKVVELGLAAPTGIAVDWLGLNIYWTDPLMQKIEVTRLLGSSRKTLLWEGQVSDPHSIVLDPPNGHMYWSEWGASRSIKKGAMDGSNIKKLLPTKGYATQLTLDYDNRRLYWLEINSPSIWSSDLDGNDARIIIEKNIFQPTALALYKQFIYWSDNDTGEVIKANKLDGSKRQIIQRNSYNITDLQVYHSEQHGSNQCAVSNGGCKHLCLALPADLPENGAKYTCSCPTHYSRVNYECIPPKQFMIYGQRNLTVRVLPSPSDCSEAVLPIQGLKGVKAIDFDPVHKFLYWIEGKTHSIRRADVTGAQVFTVVHGNKEMQPYDLVVDSLGQLLFWTSKDVINVTRLSENFPFGVVVKRKNEEPKLLAIHLTKRLLFYTDVGPARQLVRIRLDGTHRLIITKDADIAAIAVDQENDWIVWSKGQSIYMSNIEGENQVVLVNHTATRATQLTILSGWLYWIDREFQLQRVELQSGNQSFPLSLQASQIVDLISVSQPDQNHPCFYQKKKCSHLCILNGTNPVCACPQGNVLKGDKHICSALQKCGTDRFTCALPSENQENCIPLSWRCDGQRDCVDGSDEINCPECRKDQFKCKDGSCISLNNACDGVPHCTDQSDEEMCCTDGFQCPNTHVCLPRNVVCDKIDNCADGADEHPSYCNKLNSNSSGLIWTITGVSVVILVGVGIFCYMKKLRSNEDFKDQSEDSLSPMQPKPHIKMRKGIPDVVRMSIVTGSETSYDRNHITGASSSTNESNLTCYPREPLNPPPSPATTRGSSPSSRYRPYRHYRTINQPPPPTPCSTDVCDESDCNYPTRSRYDGGPFPPPPTPRSQCHSESCPPSPSSRSSMYFNPFPPPPSPVASPPRGYDS